MTLLAGMCPGILTGVLTNVLCSVFDANALYFSLISALIAILTALYDRRKGQEKAGATVVLILLLALVGSVLGTAFQYLLIGSSRIETAARVWQEAPGGAGAFFASMHKNTLVNVIDKALSVLLALLALKLIPRRTKERIHNSIWLQEPLSDAQAAALSRHRGHRSISARIGLTLLSVAVILAIALGWISINLYNRNIKKEYAENALHATRLASKVIDADSFDEYIRDGKGVPGYRETEEMLYRQPIACTDGVPVRLPDTMQLRCVIRGSELFTIPADRTECPVEEIYNRAELPAERLGYVCYPLFCGNYVFGMLVCGADAGLFEIGEFLTFQLSRAICMNWVNLSNMI